MFASDNAASMSMSSGLSKTRILVGPGVKDQLPHDFGPRNVDPHGVDSHGVDPDSARELKGNWARVLTTEFRRRPS